MLEVQEQGDEEMIGEAEAEDVDRESDCNSVDHQVGYYSVLL